MNEPMFKTANELIDRLVSLAKPFHNDDEWEELELYPGHIYDILFLALIGNREDKVNYVVNWLFEHLEGDEKALEELQKLSQDMSDFLEDYEDALEETLHCTPCAYILSGIDFTKAALPKSRQS